MIGHLCDTNIVASLYKQWQNSGRIHPSIIAVRKVLETFHLL